MVICIAPKNETNEKTTRGSLPESVQSESDLSRAEDPELTNQTKDLNHYVITYPIETFTCDVCKDTVTPRNPEVRNHLTNDHNILNISYTCSLCSKEYQSINAVKTHFVACKKSVHSANIGKKDANDTHVASSQIVNTSNTTNVQNQQQIDPLQCIECHQQNIFFLAQSNRGLSNHRRCKHPREYEESKTVASKRIAWNVDEDLILAQLEVDLKAKQKSCIAERLFEEYNKIAEQSKAPPRTKRAIISRRLGSDNKELLKSIQESITANPSSSDDEDSTRQATTVQGTRRQADSTAIDEIKKFLDTTVKSNNSLTASVKGAATAFINGDTTINILGTTIKGIYERIEEQRNEERRNISSRIKSLPNNRKKPIRSSSRQQKARTHGYYQRLYYRNKQRLVDEVLDGEISQMKPPPITIAEDFYKNIWSRTVIDQSPFISKPSVDDALIFNPITESEISMTIKGTKKETATGPDRVTLREITALAGSELLVAMNIWLGLRKIPIELKKNKTILIPKANADLTNVKNWRPITISSIILRIYNKIIGNRINQVFKTSDKQVGFKPVNGCGMNIAWLHSLLKHARLNKNSIYVCLIDVSKAFDSVSHQSITRALSRNGASVELINLIIDQYTDSSTFISYEDAKSNEISITCGVKQGDPLSSILFNLVIDELFDVVKDDHGYQIPGIGDTNARCFADDLCLVSSSRIGMNALLTKTTIFLADRGLAVNPSKCITIGLAKGLKGKKSKIEENAIFSINNTSIPMLGFTDKTTRYLGIRFTSLGAIDYKNIKSSIKDALDRIVKLKLKAECKVNLLRYYVIPRFIFQLIHTEVYPSELPRIDILIRKALKNILHLPISLSSEFFYLPLKEGGLQFPVIKELVGLAKVKLHKKLIHSGDAILRHLTDLQRGSITERYITSLGLGESCSAADMEIYKERFLKEKRTSYSAKIHSAGQEIFSTCPMTNRWLRGETKSLKTGIYIKGVKLRTNTYETKVTTTRGLSVDKSCRGCELSDESQMHVLQCCPATKGLRYNRHHRICKKVANKLTQQNYQVYTERSFPDPNNIGSTLRPDIIAIKDSKALVFDVSVVYEVSGAGFKNAYQRKVEKYQPLSPLINLEFQCVQTEVHGLIIGSRGAYFHQQLPIWYQLGFKPYELRFIAIGCMEDSIKVISVFNQRGRQ